MPPRKTRAAKQEPPAPAQDELSAKPKGKGKAARHQPLLVAEESTPNVEASSAKQEPSTPAQDEAPIEDTLSAKAKGKGKAARHQPLLVAEESTPDVEASAAKQEPSTPAQDEAQIEDTLSAKAKGKGKAARHQPLLVAEESTPDVEASAAKQEPSTPAQDEAQIEETPVPSATAKGKGKSARHQPLLVAEESTPDAEASSATLQDRKAKLAELRAKMAATTKANRRDILAEQARSRSLAADGKKPSARKLQKAEAVLEARDLSEAGEDVERYRNMLYSVEDSERWDARLEEKERRKDQGVIDFQDAAERSYQRQVRQMKPDLAGYRQQRDASSPAASSALVDTIHYGSHTPSDDAIDRVVSHLNHEQQTIKTRSRKRTEDPDADITYINDRNKHFNNKLKRFFDNKTKEIRDNLERGTAL